MRINTDKVWAGTEESLQASLQADDTIQKNLQAGNFGQPDDEDEGSRLLDIVGNVAVISIKGSLTNDGDAWWNEMTGRTGYPEIRDALLAAANDQAVTQIVLDIDSGGGSVSGVADTGSLIRLINTNVKPVTTFTDGAMMSAAYWLGSSAGKVYGTKSSMQGSIGVIATHMEKSKMLADAGIGVTVVRSGEFKALANSVEPLSAEGKAQIQKVVNAANTVFVDHVGEMRNTPAATVESVWGQGREFLAEEALAIGMIDGITTFDDLIGGLSDKLIDASNNSMDNRVKPQQPIRGESVQTLSGEKEMSKKALTAQDIAALAAGAAIAAETQTTAPAVETQIEPAAPVAEAPAATPVVEASVADVAKLNATVQLLTEQNLAKDAALLQANVALAQVKGEVETLKASIDPLVAIAAKSVGNMQVALGGTAMTAAGMTASQIVVEHGRVETLFATKFPVGGVAAASHVDPKVSGVKVDPLHMARVNAARFQK